MAESTTHATGSPTEAPADGHTEADHTGHAHPTERQYIKIALILGAITLAEVGVYYIEDSLEGLLIPILTAMAVVKFAMVVMWFMHLKFDNKLFRRFFVTGIVLAMFCFVIVLTTFHVFS